MRVQINEVSTAKSRIFAFARRIARPRVETSKLVRGLFHQAPSVAPTRAFTSEYRKPTELLYTSLDKLHIALADLVRPDGVCFNLLAPANHLKRTSERIVCPPLGNRSW